MDYNTLQFRPVKILSSIMLFIWSQLLKILPQLSQGWPQLFSYGKCHGDNFFRARASPERKSSDSIAGKGEICYKFYLLVQPKHPLDWFHVWKPSRELCRLWWLHHLLWLQLPFLHSMPPIKLRGLFNSYMLKLLPWSNDKILDSTIHAFNIYRWQIFNVVSKPKPICTQHVKMLY